MRCYCVVFADTDPDPAQYRGAAEEEDECDNSIRCRNGGVQLGVTYLAAGGFGKRSHHRRIYSNRLSVGTDRGNGYNWSIDRWPYVVEHADGSVAVVRSPRNTLSFNLENGNYVGQNGTLAVMVDRTERPEKMFRKGTLIVAGTILIVMVAFIIVAKPIEPERTMVSEDATMVDRGPLSYRPRYIVSFPQIAMTSDSRYEFHTRHLPPAPMTFQLSHVASSPMFTAEQAGTLTVRISGEDQQEVYGVSAPLTDWIVHKPHMNLWHFSLRDLSFKSNATYSIDIKFSGLESPQTNSLFVPQFRGGGIELP
jgi:hypothetical protein